MRAYTLCMDAVRGLFRLQTMREDNNEIKWSRASVVLLRKISFERDTGKNGRENRIERFSCFSLRNRAFLVEKF